MAGIVDGQNLLETTNAAVGSDLPDYATAMTDPRFAKKPIYPVPPPPYAAVVELMPDSPADHPSTVTSTDTEVNPPLARDNVDGAAIKP